MLEQLLAWDTALFLTLNNWGSPAYDFIWLLLSEKATNVVVYLVFIVAYGRKFGWKYALRLFLFSAVLVGITDQITNGFKYGFMRLRPCHTPSLDGSMRLVKLYCGGKYSFFSGHASNSFALATLFAFLFKAKKGIPYFFFLLAGLIAYSRVYIGVHFPLDILCGAVAGIGIASLLYSLLKKRFAPLFPVY